MTLEVPDTTADLLRQLMAQASSHRIPVDDYLRTLVDAGRNRAVASRPPRRVTRAEFTRWLAEIDAATDASPNRVVHDPPFTYSREDIYFDHD